MENLQLLIDLHLPGTRQGPGGDAETQRAIDLSGLRGKQALKIADIGCGTGASTLILARELDAEIIAIDFLPAFLDVLKERAQAAGLAERITPQTAAMEALAIPSGSLDAIWSEGAIYNMGFEKGVQDWRRFLKPGGILAVSELTWLTDSRPAELEQHWHSEYPEVGTAASKMAVLERNGYTPLAYFVLPERCWLEAYYRPMQQRFAAFLAAHQSSEAAKAIVAAEAHEIDLYERHKSYISYGFYIARKTDDES
jgi:ubiquinone/menaquinone biosynthesis C-methylase UbiE